MENNNNKRESNILSVISDIVSISGITLAKIVEEILIVINKEKGLQYPNFVISIIDFIEKYWVIIYTIIIFIILYKFLVNRIQQYRKKQDILSVYTKVNFLFKLVMFSLLFVVLLFEWYYYIVGVDDLKAKNTNDKLQTTTDDTNNLTIRDQIIEEYIQKCCNTDVTKEEFLKLSNEQLQLIINGIYAYSGCEFSGGYFERFSWYKGDIPFEKFTWDMFKDEYSKKNINVILSIMRERD